MLWMRTAAMTALFLLAVGTNANAGPSICSTSEIGSHGGFCDVNRRKDPGNHDPSSTP
jgi:hypothetical protein